VDAVRFAGDTEKTPHKVAVIKIEKALLGAAGVTHVKVGFLPPPLTDPAVPPGRGGRGGFQPIHLIVEQSGVFFLTRHPSGKFYTITPMMAPLNARADNYKSQAEQVEKAAAALADPMKALTADKAADRFLAAAALLSRYRSFPEDGRETELQRVSADESRLILKSIAEADWKRADQTAPGAMQLFFQLGLNPESGFHPPQAQPGADYTSAVKDAFVKWLAGPGKDFRIERIVPKKK
jgi:hypothetical protein